MVNLVIAHKVGNIIPREIDIIINEIKTNKRISNYSHKALVIIEIENNTIKILFNFIEYEELTLRQFLVIEKTRKLFFMSDNQLGIVDLEERKLLELKETFTSGYPERVSESIIFDDELSVKSYSINGKFISEIPIDPPTIRKDFEDYLEYISPIFGTMRLKIE